MDYSKMSVHFKCQTLIQSLNTHLIPSDPINMFSFLSGFDWLYWWSTSPVVQSSKIQILRLHSNSRFATTAFQIRDQDRKCRQTFFLKGVTLEAAGNIILCFPLTSITRHIAFLNLTLLMNILPLLTIIGFLIMERWDFKHFLPL